MGTDRHIQSSYERQSVHAGGLGEREYASELLHLTIKGGGWARN